MDDVLKPVNTVRDKWKILPSFFEQQGVARQHIESFNHFVNNEIKNIVAANNRITSENSPTWFFEYTNVYISQPSVRIDDREASVTPHECRTRDITYSAPILVDIIYKIGKETVKRSGVCIGRLPMMLRSCNCILNGKSSSELAELKECSLDPGGYFVVKGVEKVILIKEQLSKNRIIVEKDNKGFLCATVTSASYDWKTRTNVIYKDRRLYLQHNSFTQEIPLMIVFKAMGVESDQEVVQLVCGPNEALMERLSSTVYETSAYEIRSQEEALNYIGKLLKSTTRIGAARENRIEEGREILASVIYSHVPTKDFHMRPKILFLSVVVRRLLQAVTDPSFMDDKDYYGNKRLELSGQLISLLFEDLFKKLNSDIRKSADSSLAKASKVNEFDAAKHIRQDSITNGMIHAISSGNWHLRRFNMDEAGVSAPLSRLSFIAALGHMTRISSHFEKTRKVAGPRSLQPSQWGAVCIADTPEGESCGLVKNLALMTHVTSDCAQAPITQILYNLGVEDIELLGGEAIHEHFLIIMDGRIVGVHRNPLQLVQMFRNLRRRGKIPKMVSIFINDRHRTVYVSTEGGRVCRPLIVVKNGKSLLTSNHVIEVSEGLRSFHDLVNDGIIEFVDVNEENDCLISIRGDDLTNHHTHVEIDPFTILGVCASLIPYPHHNQSPRNTYQCAMGKQAMGVIALNQFLRFDTVLYLLCYPQKPLCKSKQIELIGFEQLPAGQNAMVAVMSYSGYDIEDALVLNRGSVDRGYGRCMVLRNATAEIKKYPNGACDKLIGPPVDKTAPGAEVYRAIDLDGIAGPGELLRPGDVYFNKQVPSQSNLNQHVIASVGDSNGGQYKPMPQRFTGSVPVSIDSVCLTSNTNEHFFVKFRFRHVRRPELGDKFSSRHGQKGVTGIIVDPENMPFNQFGVIPDVIMNPHGFPSRMTVGKLLELLAGKSAIADGNLRYGTCFGGTPIENLTTTMIEAGYNYVGKEYLTSGETGEGLECYIYFGPVYYQKLKHMVLDKMHARARGQISSITRQPTEGRSRNGGLRVGEMERDCLVGYGASNLLRERLMISSDEFHAHVCSNCGLLCAEGWCQNCRAGNNVTTMTLPYAAKLLFQELQSMNVVPKLQLKHM
eukprot:TRINITY_DN2485_c0_g1_i1.p1 TRINITY_DN2485_c0_g1~~TRINITY_DN2485_c0_g1_i1.p1  ORF type:complete len:1132 (-),score=303.31 TRINITY_DN2485_c0_g1_i1:137-3499(-)